MIVKPAGTGTPSAVISASPIPLPPRSSRPPRRSPRRSRRRSASAGNLHSPRERPHSRDGRRRPAQPDSQARGLHARSSPGRAGRASATSDGGGDKPEWIERFYDAFRGRALRAESRDAVRRCPRSRRSTSPSQDVIYVGGGNTANMLAIWRVHGIDRALREAWERGAVLGGWSAGANCWFEDSVTDSFGPDAARARRRARLARRELLPALRRRAGAAADLHAARARRGRCRPDTPPTTTRPSTSRAPSCARSSASARAPAATGSRRRRGAARSAPAVRASRSSQARAATARRRSAASSRAGSTCRSSSSTHSVHGPNWTEPTADDLRARSSQSSPGTAGSSTALTGASSAIWCSERRRRGLARPAGARLAAAPAPADRASDRAARGALERQPRDAARRRSSAATR